MLMSPPCGMFPSTLISLNPQQRSQKKSHFLHPFIMSGMFFFFFITYKPKVE